MAGFNADAGGSGAANEGAIKALNSMTEKIRSLMSERYKDDPSRAAKEAEELIEKMSR